MWMYDNSVWLMGDNLQFRDVEAAKDDLRKDIRRTQVAQLRAGASM